MIAEHHLSDYETVRAGFRWERVARELAAYSGNAGLNIAHLAVDHHSTGALGDTVAIRFIRKDASQLEFTYSGLAKLTSRFANALRALGLKKGERVFSLTGRIPELYITALGSLKYGAVFCPLFSVFGPEPVLQRMHKGEATVVVTTSALFEKKVKPLLEQLPALRFVLLTDAPEHISDKVLSFSVLMNQAGEDFTIPWTSPDDPALLHFTSGTTGMPKGVLHVHQAVLTHYITGKYVLDFHPGDVFWCTADPGWVTGTSYGILSPLLNGVTMIVDQEEFDALRWYSILEAQQVSIWYTAPTAIRRLMRMDIDPHKQFRLDKLRLVLSVGEPLHAEGVRWGEEKLGMPILDNWWQTETGGIMIANYASMKVKPGSMGRPLPGVEVAIAAIVNKELKLINEPNVEGHLVIRKGWPSMFRTYLHEEERYQKCFIGDWYVSGDLAKVDEDGYFWFVGRADDIIKTSGHMVGPFEVESTLMRHSAVAEAAVIGKPEPAIGELVKAFVVLKPGILPSETVMLDIMAFARKELGPAVAPKEIAFLDSIPKTRSGKILRRLLKARELGLPEGDLSTLETT